VEPITAVTVALAGALIAVLVIALVVILTVQRRHFDVRAPATQKAGRARRGRHRSGRPRRVRVVLGRSRCRRLP
jgi:hypothetical protein